MQLSNETGRRIEVEQPTIFSEKIFLAARKMRLSEEALDVLAKIINQSPKNLNYETLEKWGDKIKAEVTKCLIQASSMIRQATYKIGSLDALERICEFLHVITGEDIYIFLMSMYRDREDHPSRTNQGTLASVEIKIVQSVNSDTASIIQESELAEAA